MYCWSRLNCNTLTPDVPCKEPVISVCTPNTQCMLYKRQYCGKKQKNKKTMISISFSKTLRERNVLTG